MTVRGVPLGWLNFSWRLIQAPLSNRELRDRPQARSSPAALDHPPKFRAKVEALMPDYGAAGVAAGERAAAEDMKIKYIGTVGYFKNEGIVYTLFTNRW